MAEIELAPLSHRLDDDEMKTLSKLLEEIGAPTAGRSDYHVSHTIAARLSEEALTEFLDRLDAHDLGAEIYLPIEFEGRVTVGDYRVASTQALLDVLEEMREELDVDTEDEEEDEEDEDIDDVEASLDVILKERLVVEDEEDEEDDEEVGDVDERGDSPLRVLPKQPGEFVCQSCFLVKHPSQLADKDLTLCRDCV